MNRRSSISLHVYLASQKLTFLMNGTFCKLSCLLPRQKRSSDHVGAFQLSGDETRSGGKNRDGSQTDKEERQGMERSPGAGLYERTH